MSRDPRKGGAHQLAPLAYPGRIHREISGFKECIESAFQFNRKRITAREYAAQVVEFLAVKIRIARYRFKQGRYTRDIIGLFLFDELCIFLNIELRNKNACSADFKHRVYADAESETVENRHCRQHSCMTHNAVAYKGYPMPLMVVERTSRDRSGRIQDYTVFYIANFKVGGNTVCHRYVITGMKNGISAVK